MLVTGATQGIGLETAVELARRGATVVMHGRDKARSEAALADARERSGGQLELLLADLGSLADVRRLASDFKARHDRLDVLLNNAGAMHTHRKTTADGFEATFAVNHLAPFLLTNLLLDVLRKSAPSRVVTVASEAHRRGGQLDFSDLMSERDYSIIGAYGRSKLANIHFARELARRLAGTRVTSNCLHPGVIASGFAKNDRGVVAFFAKLAAPFLLTPEQGARTSVYCASAKELEAVTGKYFNNCKEHRTAREGDDAAVAKKLWEVSEKLVGIA